LPSILAYKLYGVMTFGTCYRNVSVSGVIKYYVTHAVTTNMAWSF